MPFENAVDIKQKLESQETLEESRQVSGFGRYKEMAPNVFCLICMGAGLILVLLLTAGRLTFPKWPLHPVLLLTWATEPLNRMCGAFLVGWLIKVLVVKYGGRGGFQRLKPLIMGLIAGEVMGAILPSIVGVVYFLITGESPKAFHVLPG